MTQVLLYYKYVPSWSEEEVAAMIKWQTETAGALLLSGRIRVASEGLNVNVTGAALAIGAYCASILSWNKGSLNPVDFKIAETEKRLEFRGLKVWAAFWKDFTLFIQPACVVYNIPIFSLNDKRFGVPPK